MEKQIFSPILKLVLFPWSTMLDQDIIINIIIFFVCFSFGWRLQLAMNLRAVQVFISMHSITFYPNFIRFYSCFTVIYLQFDQSPGISLVFPLGTGDVFGERRGGEIFPFLKSASSKLFTVDTESCIFLLISWCHLFPQLHLNFNMVE